MYQLMIAPRHTRMADDTAVPVTAAEALAAVATAKRAAAALIAAGSDDERGMVALRQLAAAMETAAPETPTDPDNSMGWQRVADALGELVTWLQNPLDTQKRVSDPATREEQIIMSVGRLGRSARRRNDPAEAIISTFEAGLIGVAKLTYHALRLTVHGIAAVSNLTIAGVIHVNEYYRNGQLVSAHDRGSAAKSELKSDEEEIAAENDGSADYYINGFLVAYEALKNCITDETTDSNFTATIVDNSDIAKQWIQAISDNTSKAGLLTIVEGINAGGCNISYSARDSQRAIILALYQEVLRASHALAKSFSAGQTRLW